MGADCSLRVCPYDVAWNDMPTATDTAHALAECSNRGNCNRLSGFLFIFLRLIHEDRNIWNVVKEIASAWKVSRVLLAKDSTVLPAVEALENV